MCASCSRSPASTSFRPTEGREVAFAGRSNSGKSSAINAITVAQRAGACQPYSWPNQTTELLRARTRPATHRPAGLWLCRGPRRRTPPMDSAHRGIAREGEPYGTVPDRGYPARHRRAGRAAHGMGRGRRLAGARAAHEVRQAESARSSRTALKDRPGAVRSTGHRAGVLGPRQDRRATRPEAPDPDAGGLFFLSILMDAAASAAFSFVGGSPKKESPGVLPPGPD